MPADLGRWMSAMVVAVLLPAISGCAARIEPLSHALTDVERAAIADTIRQLYREGSRIVDSELDCDEIGERMRTGFVASYFVAQGRIIDTGESRDGASLCEMMRRERLSAREDIEEQRVDVLSRDAAVMATRGVYTVNYRDGRTMVRPQVVTVVWTRGPAGWRRVHLHESWPADRDATVRADTAAENVRVVRRMMEEGWNGRDPAAIEAAHHPDAVFWNNGRREDTPCALPCAAQLAAYDRQFSEWRLDAEDIFATQDRVAVRWTFHGRLRQTGQNVSLTGNWIARMRDRKVAESWEATDWPDVR